MKKRLPDPEKKGLPPRTVLDEATIKASTTTALRKEKDYAFLIQRYTACRKGADNGLRHCDVDLENKTITFMAWEKVVSYQKIRGGKRREKQIRRLKSEKDERKVPMSKALYEAIKIFHLLRVQMILSGRIDIKRMMILGDPTTALNIRINMVYLLMT